MRLRSPRPRGALRCGVTRLTLCEEQNLADCAFGQSTLRARVPSCVASCGLHPDARLETQRAASCALEFFNDHVGAALQQLVERRIGQRGNHFQLAPFLDLQIDHSAFSAASR